MGNYNEAIESFDKAIELDRKSIEAWEGKGEALKALHRDTEANQAFAKAKELGYTKKRIVFQPLSECLFDPFSYFIPHTPKCL